LFNDENEECEQMGDNLVAIQTLREKPANKGHLSTHLSQNNSNNGMQPNLGVDKEGQPLEE
jgi:hypothetical protein